MINRIWMYFLIFISLFVLMGLLFFNIFTILVYTGDVDFDAFMISGRQALAGKNPYETVFPDDDLILCSPNLNPPISVPLFVTLATLDGPTLRWF
ncbi:MAG: hypothetical protein ACOX9A_00435 [Anaerolineae bacterium]|jgi:hypothetical protein